MHSPKLRGWLPQPVYEASVGCCPEKVNSALPGPSHFSKGTCPRLPLSKWRKVVGVMSLTA